MFSFSILKILWTLKLKDDLSSSVAHLCSPLCKRSGSFSRLVQSYGGKIYLNFSIDRATPRAKVACMLVSTLPLVLLKET